MLPSRMKFPNKLTQISAPPALTKPKLYVIASTPETVALMCFFLQASEVPQALEQVPLPQHLPGHSTASKSTSHRSQTGYRKRTAGYMH